MKLKTLFIILIILVLGVLAVILLNKKQSVTTSADSYSLPAINNDNIKTIKIKTANNEFQIQKTDNNTDWQVADKKADSSKIDTFLKSLSTVEVQGPVSTSESNYSRFNVDETNGTDITILNNQKKELLHLIIGKIGSDYNSTYFKPANNKNVYSVNSTWGTSVYKTANDWRDKTIWAFADGQVKKIIAKDGWKSYEAKEVDGSWTINYNGNSKNADNLTTDSKKLIANNFGSTDLELKNNLILFDGDDQKLASFNLTKDDSNYYLKNDNGGDIFTVPAYTFEKVWLPVLFTK